MTDFRTKIANLQQKNKAVNYFGTNVSLSTLIFGVLLPNLIFAIISQSIISSNEDDQCPGWSWININEYLYKYSLFTFVTIGLSIFSALTSLLAACDLEILPTIMMLITIICFICYYIFLYIWQFVGIFVLVHTAPCISNVLKQWSIVLIILLSNISLITDISKHAKVSSKSQETNNSQNP